jgi:hypothetical protein
MLRIGLLASLPVAGAAAQPLPPGTVPPLRPSPTAPPPPGRGFCTESLPCRSALNEAFYYTPSGDKRYVTRR